MPLTYAKPGEKNYIKKISGKDDVRSHLATMGFVVGECVEVVCEFSGNMILNVKNSRVAIDKTMAQRIMI